MGKLSLPIWTSITPQVKIAFEFVRNKNPLSDDIKANCFTSHSERKDSISQLSHIKRTTKPPKAASKAKATVSSAILKAALPKDTTNEKKFFPFKG
jgi:hypothetical protein